MALADQPPQRTRGLLLALLLTALLAGCASTPEGGAEEEEDQRDASDPFEPFNRTMYAFNDSLDRTVARPVAVAYRDNVPRPVRTGVSNFLDNLTYPVVIVNTGLQGKFTEMLQDTGRFLINTTVGVVGIFDPASRLGLEAGNEDMGQTLGVWGTPPGPYLVWPVYGPSTARDTAGASADGYLLDPTASAVSLPERYAVYVMRGLDARVGLLDVDHMLEQEYDPYIAMREAYLQRREFLIRDGELPDTDDYWDDEWDDGEGEDEWDW